MVKPQRVQRRRAKGWRTPPNTVYVGRPSKWGNPFMVGKHGTQSQCVDLYTLLITGFLNISTGRAHVAEQERVMKHVGKNYRSLKGKNLSCFCSSGKPCHADVLLKLANGDTIKVPEIQRIN